MKWHPISRAFLTPVRLGVESENLFEIESKKTIRFSRQIKHRNDEKNFWFDQKGSQVVIVSLRLRLIISLACWRVFLIDSHVVHIHGFSMDGVCDWASPVDDGKAEPNGSWSVADRVGLPSDFLAIVVPDQFSLIPLETVDMELIGKIGLF